MVDPDILGTSLPPLNNDAVAPPAVTVCVIAPIDDTLYIDIILFEYQDEGLPIPVPVGVSLPINVHSTIILELLGTVRYLTKAEVEPDDDTL